MSDSTEVKLHFLDYWRVIKARLGIIILTFLLTMITAGVTVYFMPREYLSKATIEVKADDTALTRVYDNGMGAGGNDPRLSPTQFKIIQEKEILYPVIQNLDLCKKWAGTGAPLQMEQAYGKLLGMLDMSVVRQTDLIEIGVWSTDKEEAAEIANTIAYVYRDVRIKDQTELLDTGLQRLKDEVTEQGTQVAKLDAAAAKIRSDEGIVDPDPDAIGAGSELEISPVKVIESNRDEQNAKVTELQTQLDQVNKLSNQQILVGLHMLNMEDPTVTKILPLLQDTYSLEADYTSTGLGPNHPKVRAIEAQRKVYESDLDQAIDSIKATMATRLEVAKTTLAALDDNLRIANDQYIKSKNARTDYTDAKYNYLEAKHLLEAAQQRLATQQAQENIGLQVAKVWEKAEPALAAGRPKVFFLMLLAAIVGALLGTLLAFFLEYLDTSVKSLEDVERFLGVPVLAVVPKNAGILMHQNSDSQDAETYRILRTNLEFNRKTPDANTLTLISGGPGEGKSTTLFNLAYTCAKGGYSVLVVDADLRRPSQHRLFGVENNVGLSNYLTSNMPFEEVVRTTGVENLSFIPSGQLPRDSVGILNSQRMTDLIRNTKVRYDLVMFDSPPILGVSDGAVLASEVDLSIMVIEHRRFPRSMLQRVKQAVQNVGGNLLGVVLNKVDAKHDSGYGYYGSYYDYYSTQNGEHPEKPPQPVAAKTNGRKPQAAEHEVHGDQY